MKNIELNDEELAMVNTFRVQKVKEAELKAQQEATRKKHEAERLAARGLEEKFKTALNQATGEIEVHIENARKELNLAVAISEKYGIPFSTDVVEFTDRQYIPKSMAKHWPGVDYDILDELDIYLHGDGPGWEYWSSSSLTC